MVNAQWLLELALLLLLAATLFHAMRLERALGVLKQDRAVLEELVEGFNDSTRQAESGIERLRAAADGAGRHMARQIESAQKLRDDLHFLADRSDRVAERLETVLRSARMFTDRTAMSLSSRELPTQTRSGAAPGIGGPPVHPVAEANEPELALMSAGVVDDSSQPTRLRSQAERDLLRVLRGGR